MSRQAAKVVLAVALIVGTPGRALDLPKAQVSAVAPPVILTSVSENQLIENEAYRNRANRFIQASNRREIWFQDAKTLSIHLIRFSCDACGEPPPCKNPVLVRHTYIGMLQKQKKQGEDFACQMWQKGIVHINPDIRPIVTITHTTTRSGTTRSGAAAGGSSSGGGWIFIFLLLLCCCLGGLGFAAYHFMAKKKGPKRKDKQNKNKFAAEDQVPLVSDDSGDGEIAGLQQRTATAPTYTVMPPQMGQQQPGFQAQTAMMGQTGMYQQQPQQEMELITITPDGYSVTPLGPGQAVPAGVPVFGQMPSN
mmetsp:Transcript_131086/g.261565  ORF Transcript_131086/g.261565 Transcript_131086/m.261565 type:complete len:307 (+) Transcript_131086:60-980(+)|eukprot:CAMPEP_0172872448 /NCGR_PEP_ID=MMETSP1075-20121228/92642_1 /TAXON_ID=2916 /ORGANISM="Ceratium fusus, Strain PA161109" /LENGTH=306 /DNA_ID=CAMNT_0013722777 /DNA_START=59 /DNA_END=979 /DNA_ORIENTATION=-